MSWGDTGSRRWTVAQIGHREEYAAARAFAAEDRLARLYTDAWCRHGTAVLRNGPAGLRRLALRYHPALRDAPVTAWTTRSMATQLTRAVVARRRPEPDYDEYLRVGRWFDAKVRGSVERQPLAPGRDVFFGYNTGCLETLRYLGERGITTVVDQIDPARVEYDLVRAEAERWPGWEPPPPAVPDRYFQRMEAEWEAARLVVVNSAWSADALVQQGVARQRIAVVPLAYEPRAAVRWPPAPPHGPITVLWLGSVTLRKGIQYLVEAARLLADRPIRFVVVGPLRISQRAVAAAPRSVEFRGPVTHDRIAAELTAADVFVLPTLSDGFGLAQLEAMAHGLPVVTTPSCGQVTDDGRDGLIVPSADAGALAGALARLDDDRDLLAQMSERAPRKAEQFSLDRYRAGLEAAVTRLTSAPTG